MNKTAKKKEKEEYIESKKFALLDKYVNQEDVKKVLDPSKMDLTVLERLPKPTGWRVLILPYSMAPKTKGGIYIPEKTLERESYATVVGYVVSLGPDAYKDKSKYPDGPWCKEKDWVIFGRYAGARFKMEDGEMRLLNDDEILATVQNPEDVFNA